MCFVFLIARPALPTGATIALASYLVPLNSLSVCRSDGVIYHHGIETVLMCSVMVSPGTLGNEGIANPRLTQHHKLTFAQRKHILLPDVLLVCMVACTSALFFLFHSLGEAIISFVMGKLFRSRVFAIGLVTILV